MSTQGNGHQRGVAAGIALVIASATGVVGLVAALSLAISSTMEALAPDTDVSAANAVFSGLAFGAVLVAMIVQHGQLRRQNSSLATQLQHMEAANGYQRRADITSQHRLQFELLSKAMDDPDLAEVLNAYGDHVPPVRRRQYLYANALYGNLLHAYRIGSTSERDLNGHVKVICRSPLFREYWRETRQHRAELPYESVEAKLGRMVDRVIDERPAG
ncbi:hypothetical protein HW130_23425 [Streptomyces sp. PKU-EA00015]|uniref:DUF6082 family protein n=1 Tax=Streptomyces sp. PKU-EA00015 TaxID=2748326 RepID=UPI0015A12ED9|nr:DUF6082 family protein [Streptomyces sp. PKU-EA00015]NWF29168.1 hypothetical protein [Streptomyces sp. PKU-EA00015]